MSESVPLDAHLRDFACIAFGGVYQYDISEFVVSLTWSDSFDQPSMQMDLTLANPGPVPSKEFAQVAANPQAPGGPTRLNDVVRVGTGIRVFAALPQPQGGWIPLRRSATGAYSLQNEIFRGYVFTKQTGSASDGEQMSVTCYDNMIYLAKNEDDRVYKRRTATQIIQDLCDDFEIKTAPTGAQFTDTKYQIPKIVAVGRTLWDIAWISLQKTRSVNRTRRYLLRSESGKVCLRERLRPDRVWNFSADTNILTSNRTYSIEDSITRIQVMTTVGNQRRDYGEPLTNPRMARLFGVMQRLDDVGATNVADARKAALQTIRTEGWPREEITVEVPCLCSVRAGEMVVVRDREAMVSGDFYVSGVSHSVDASNATSTFTLVRKITQAEVQPLQDDSEDFTKTSRFVLQKRNGKVVRYSVHVGIKTLPKKLNLEEADEEGMVAWADRGSQMGDLVGRHVRVYYASFSVAVKIIGSGDYPWALMISDVAAESLTLKTEGLTLRVSPLVQKSTTTSSQTGGPDPSVIVAIVRFAKQYGADPVVMVATALQESNATWHAAGDKNQKTGRFTSFGPFQHHEGGALGNHTREWAESPDGVEERARAFAAAHAHTGEDAADIQKPGDRAGYAKSVNALIPAAKDLVDRYG